MAWADLGDPVYVAVREHFTANWPHADVPVKWPNEAVKITPQQPWIAVEYQGDLYGQQSLGADLQENNRWDQDGLIWFHIFCPDGSGIENSSGAADAIMRIFRGKLLMDGDLEFLDAHKGAGGPGDEEGTWFRISVSIEWRRTEA